MGRQKRTNSSTLNHVPDGKSLYRLVLWGATRAVGAADRLDVTSSLLVATAVVDMSVSGLGFLTRVWEVYLDARFLTMVAVLEEVSMSETIAASDMWK